jgi:hypothetical protein
VAEWLLLAALGLTGAGALAATAAMRRRRARTPASGPIDAGASVRSPSPRSASVAEPPPVSPSAAPTASLESAWRTPLDDARTRLEINLAIAESAMRMQRPRHCYADEAGRLRALQLIRTIRAPEDEPAWAVLEPLTTSGEYFHLMEFARAYGGEFGARSLQACAERLWRTRLARSQNAALSNQRRADPA